jgi:hypothetical protein
VLFRTENRAAPAFPAKASSKREKTDRRDFRAAARNVAEKVKDGEWVTRGRLLHS